jgi:hypothetical protein
VATPTTLQDDFSKGVVTDVPRNAMPKGSFWGGADLIPNLIGRLRERGGWSNGSDSISAAKATASYVAGGIYAPYTAGACQVVVDEDGEVYKVADGTTVTDVAAGVTVVQNPVFHRNIVIVPASGGATSPKKVTNSAGTLSVGNLGGSPPQGKYAAVWGDYTLLAGSTAQPQRLYFSDPGDPEGWDTTNTYWDFTQPINGLAALRSAIFAFHDGTMSRLRGTTPPPGSDFFADDPIFTVGCTDARSIALRGDRVAFANGEGIFYTDGSAEPANITKLCGRQSYWQEQLTSYDKASWTISGGFLRDKYFVSVMNGSSFVLAAFIDLDRLSWWPLTNLKAVAMWAAQGATDKLYFGRRDAARVGELSSIFMPASGVKNDGDGTAVTATFESPYYEGKFGAKTVKKVYVDHELTDYGSDDPTATIGYISTPEDLTYTTLSTGLSESTTKTTTKATIGGAHDGIAFKITRSGAGDFKLYGLEAEIDAREASRRAA